jgi:hypothetical protein
MVCKKRILIVGISVLDAFLGSFLFLCAVHQDFVDLMSSTLGTFVAAGR